MLLMIKILVTVLFVAYAIALFAIWGTMVLQNKFSILSMIVAIIGTVMFWVYCNSLIIAIIVLVYDAIVLGFGLFQTYKQRKFYEKLQMFYKNYKS